MKEGSINRLFLVLLSLMLVTFLVGSINLQSSAADEANLGKSLGEILLNWKLLMWKDPSFIEESGLDSSLVSLSKSLKSVNAPTFLVNRVPPLRKKLERKKSGDTFVPQLGFWNFVDANSSVSLSGAQKVEDIRVLKKTESSSDPRRIGFRYLKFSAKEDRAIIRAAEKMNASSLERFTIEFWARFRDREAEKLVSSGDWYLGVNGSKLALNKPQAGVILTGEEINPGYWTHIALTWDGKTINLYRNGNKVASASYSGSLNITEEIVFGGGFIGDIDQLRVKDRSVSRSSLHFDLRINYLLGFPIISWVQKNLTPEELWRFYAGFFFSNISIKRESGQYSVTGKKLNQVAEFLLAETDKNRKIPSDLSEGLLEDIKKMRDLGGDGEITEEETGSLDQILENLSNYLGLS